MKDNKILNKQIGVFDIIAVAEILERYKEKWSTLFEIEERKNKDLPWKEKKYTYNNGSVSLRYSIGFKDGNTLTEKTLDWFKDNLNKAKDINDISIYFSVHFSTNNSNDSYDFESNRISVILNFRENQANIDVDTTLQENEGRMIYNEIMKVFDNCSPRHDTVIKKKGLITQAYCLAVGIILTYFLYGAFEIIQSLNPQLIPNSVMKILTNAWVVVIGQWLLAFFLGNIFANMSIYNIYKIIVPDTRYAGYDYNKGKGIYKDDLQDFKNHSEIQIGKYHDAKSKRIKILKKYEFSKNIIFFQLILSVIFFFALTVAFK